MSRLKSLGAVWSTAWATLREIDVHAIREESERSLTLACVGHPDALDVLADLLYADIVDDNDQTLKAGVQYGPAAGTPLVLYHLPLTVAPAELQRADILLLVVDGREPISPPALGALEQLQSLSLPFLVVILYSDGLPGPLFDGAATPPPAGQVLAIGDPDVSEAIELLGIGLLSRLPGEFHLSAARSLPGLRPTVARDLITGTAFSNGSYALLASLSEHFPVLNMTVSAADMLVLTKNQVLLVYKLALAHGAPAEFQANMREMLAVVGLAYIWRQVARSLIKMFPAAHIAPRVAVSYAATYSVGLIAWRWFAYGELVSGEELQHFAQEALEQGQKAFRMLQAQMHQDTGAAPNRLN